MSVSEEQALVYHRLVEEELDALVTADQEAYPDPWTRGMFNQEIHNACSEFFVGRLQGELAVYGGFWLVLDEAHITKVTVLPQFRGRGLGKELLSWMLNRAETMGANIARLEVRESNHPARNLYAALGFEITGVRKNYYIQTNEAAITMNRALRGA